MAAVSGRYCRFCLKVPEHLKYTVALFSSSSLKEELPALLEYIYEVEIISQDQNSKYACRNCVSTAKSLDSKLKKLRMMAKKSSEATGSTRATVGNQKRSLPGSSPASSGEGVSPLRPPRKRRPGVGRELVFPRERECSQACVDVGRQHLLSSEATEQDSHPRIVAQDENAIPTAPSSHPTVLQNSVCNVTICSPHRESPYTALLDDSFNRIGRALAGGSNDALVRSLFNHEVLRDLLITKVINIINDECLALCRRSEPSIFRKSKFTEYFNFNWLKWIEDMESKSPILLRLCKVIVSHGDKRNNVKHGKVHFPGIVTAVSVLLKERNREMLGLQTFISMVLQTSRVQKQVFSRLNHIGITISYNAILKVIASVSKSHVDPMKELIASSKTIKYVGDNLDTHRGVRDIRSDHRGRMANLYSLVLVCGRICDSSLSTTGTTGDLRQCSAGSFLPTKDDVRKMKLNLTVLISRILCTYIKCLQPFKKFLSQHIPHVYHEQMAEVSETYFLDVLLKNEAKSSDMIDIMVQMQKYLGETFPPNGKVLSGGDQLTNERQCCAQRHLMDADSPKDTLQLLEPVCEDWHTLMCFFKVLWRKLFKASSKDHGTFGYFCSLLGRLPKAKDPKKEMNACTDALFTVLKGHYVAYACMLLGISKPTEMPQNMEVLHGKSAKIEFIAKLAAQVAGKFSLLGNAIVGEEVPQTNDAVYDYARVFCHFGSLALEFKDAWGEGDGDRSNTCWKMFLLHFRASHCVKYAWEALRLQFQLVFLPPALSHQVKWERYVNTHGGPGRNIPCDLFNEHMNKLFKEIVGSMGANFTESAIQKAARSVTTLSKIRDIFDMETNVPVQAVAHATIDDESDVYKVTDVLIRHKSLTITEGRELSQFKKFDRDPLHGLDWKKLPCWIEEKKKQILRYKLAVGEGDVSSSGATDIEESDKSS